MQAFQEHQTNNMWGGANQTRHASVDWEGITLCVSSVLAGRSFRNTNSYAKIGFPQTRSCTPEPEFGFEVCPTIVELLSFCKNAQGRLTPKFHQHNLTPKFHVALLQGLGADIWEALRVRMKTNVVCRALGFWLSFTNIYLRSGQVGVRSRLQSWNGGKA